MISTNHHGPVVKNMKRWVTLSARVIGFAGLGAIGVGHAAPQLQWESESLTINAVKDQLVREPVKVLSTQYANNVRAELKGQASDVLTVVQPDIRSITPGTWLTLMVETRLPAGERRRQLQGLLQLREVGKPNGVLASPLPIRVVVNESVNNSAIIVSAKNEDGMDVSAASQVWLDGKVVAQFDGRPSVTVPASPGQHRVAVYDPMVAGAVATVHLDLGEQESVHLTTKSGGLTLVEDYQAAIAEAVGGIVPGDFSTFTIRLQRADGTSPACSPFRPTARKSSSCPPGPRAVLADALVTQRISRSVRARGSHRRIAARPSPRRRRGAAT